MINMKATYKDYNPINFDLLVKYNPNLDGKTKFVDLGTHIFFKNLGGRPKGQYEFLLGNVVD